MAKVSWGRTGEVDYAFCAKRLVQQQLKADAPKETSAQLKQLNGRHFIGVIIGIMSDNLKIIDSMKNIEYWLNQPYVSSRLSEKYPLTAQ
jgi:hypothetical protein